MDISKVKHKAIIKTNGVTIIVFENGCCIVCDDKTLNEAFVTLNHQIPEIIVFQNDQANNIHIDKREFKGGYK